MLPSQLFKMAVEKEGVHGLHEKANRFGVEVKISSSLLTSLLTYFPTIFITKYIRLLGTL